MTTQTVLYTKSSKDLLSLRLQSCVRPLLGLPGTWHLARLGVETSSLMTFEKHPIKPFPHTLITPMTPNYLPPSCWDNN